MVATLWLSPLGTGAPDIQMGKAGWLKHQEGSQGFGSAQALFGKSTGLLPVSYIPLLGQTQLLAYLGL